MFTEHIALRRGVATTAVSALALLGLATVVPTAGAYPANDGGRDSEINASSSADFPAASTVSFDAGSMESVYSSNGVSVADSPGEGARTGAENHGIEDAPRIELSHDSSLNPSGDVITVRGEGFRTTGNGVYVGLAQIGHADYLDSETFHPEAVWVSNKAGKGATQIAPDGSFEVELPVSAVFGPEDRYNCMENACAVMTVAAHGSSDRSQDTEVQVTFADSSAHSGEGAATGVVDSNKQRNDSGTASGGNYDHAQQAKEESSRKTPDKGNGGSSSTTTAPGANRNPNQANNDSVEPLIAPKVEINRVTKLKAAGDSVRVYGYGFKTTGNGVYVGLAQDDKYSTTDADVYDSGTVWVSKKRGNLRDDGSFVIDLPVKAKFGDSDCVKNKCSIYTLAAHGSSDRSQDTKTPVTFAQETAKKPEKKPDKEKPQKPPRREEQKPPKREEQKPPRREEQKPPRREEQKPPKREEQKPSAPHTSAVASARSASGAHVEISKVTGLNPQGETVTVTGSGFPTAGNGIYVGIAQQDQADFMDAESFSPSAIWVSTKKGNLNADGSFSVSLEVNAHFGNANCMENQCAIYTFAAHGSSDRSLDTIIPVNFSGGVEAQNTGHDAGRNVPAQSGGSNGASAAGAGASGGNGPGASTGSRPSANSANGSASSAGRPGSSGRPSSASASSPHGGATGGKPSSVGGGKPGSGSSKNESNGKPSVSLSTTELNPEGLTPITITGSGFKTSGPGVYVGVAEKAKFSHTDASVYGAVAFVRSSEMSADGSWSKTLQVDAIFEGGNCLVNQCAMFTLAAHGSSDRSQDTATDLTIKGGEKAAKDAQKKAEQSGRADKAKAKPKGKSDKKSHAKGQGKGSAKAGSASSADAADGTEEAENIASSTPTTMISAVVGALAVLSALGGAVFYWWRRKRVNVDNDADYDTPTSY